MAPGQAYFNDVDTTVRWPWIILSLLEIIIAIVFLLASILCTLKEPLFKSSQIALLIHGLHGWTDDELDIQWPVSAEKLEHSAAGMRSSLQKNSHGRLKFVRNDGSTLMEPINLRVP